MRREEWANRRAVAGITLVTGPDKAPGHPSIALCIGGAAAMSFLTAARSRGSRVLVAIAASAVFVSACGSGAATSPPATAPTQAPVTASATGTTIPTTPTPTATQLPSLKVLWQGAGPVTAKGLATYWPTVNPITGDIWVAASRQNQYWIFSAAGKFLEAWGMAGSGDGQLALTTHDPTPDSVGAIAFAPDGSFYIADNGNFRVEKFDKNRKFVLQWGSFGASDGQFGSPKGIATDGKSVWVGDDPRGDVQVFDTSGKFLRKFPGSFFFSRSAPAGKWYTTDESGVSVTDDSGNTIGQLAVDWGALGDFPNQFAYANGRLYGGWTHPEDPSIPSGLIELDATSGEVLHEWSNGDASIGISADGKSLYLAADGPNYTGWPYIKAVALP
jgi:hypothetical protein